MINCPDCNSENCSYSGVDDGFFGDAVCDIWLCNDCGLEFEGHCIGIENGGGWEQEAVDEIIEGEKANDDPNWLPPF